MTPIKSKRNLMKPCRNSKLSWKLSSKKKTTFCLIKKRNCCSWQRRSRLWLSHLKMPKKMKRLPRTWLWNYSRSSKKSRTNMKNKFNMYKVNIKKKMNCYKTPCKSWTIKHQDWMRSKTTLSRLKRQFVCTGTALASWKKKTMPSRSVTTNKRPSPTSSNKTCSSYCGTRTT